MVSQGKKVIAIVQARVGSTRLPGKVMMNIINKPILQHICERLRRSLRIDAIVLATTTSKEDDLLVNFAKKAILAYYRGEKRDVLSRYYGAANQFRAEVIIRICADSPLVDPQIIDEVVDKHLRSNSAYTSTGIKRTFPLGINTEVFSYDALERAYNEAKLDYEREHVTPYIYQHPKLFKIQHIEASGNLRRPDLRLTVDTEEDLRLIREIYKRLYRDDQIFYTEKVIELLEKHPELVAINAHIKQKELGE